MSSDIMPMTEPRPRRQRSQGSGAADAALLFDEPGPRGRILIAIGSVVAVIGIAALAAAVLYRLDLAGQLDYPKWRYFLGQSVVSQLLEAAGTTLTLGGVAAVLTFPLGIALGWLRLLDNRPIKWLIGLWIDAMRAVPMLLLVYFFLLVVPRFATISDFWKLALPIVMCTSATTAEVFRSGVRALDRGQTEAAWALGMSPSLTMRLILAPQALAGFLVYKGSITVDGVSLTVNHVEDLPLAKAVDPAWLETARAVLAGRAPSVAPSGAQGTAAGAHGGAHGETEPWCCAFQINLIPHTVAQTTLKRLTPGTLVNLEIDTVARYLARMQEVAGKLPAQN